MPPLCTAGVPKFARTVFEVVIAQKVSVAAANVRVLLLTGNVILMFAETVGLGMYLKSDKSLSGFVSHDIICSDTSKLFVLQSHFGHLPSIFPNLQVW